MSLVSGDPDDYLQRFDVYIASHTRLDRVDVSVASHTRLDKENHPELKNSSPGWDGKKRLLSNRPSPIYLNLYATLLTYHLIKDMFLTN